MKQILLTLLCILVVLIAAPTGSVAGTACSVAPDPLSLVVETQFTVTAAGAIPFDYYEVTDQQQGHHKTDEDRVWLGQADTNGNIDATIHVDNGLIGASGTYALWPGGVSVKVIHYQQGGKTISKGASILAFCTFSVTE